MRLKSLSTENGHTKAKSTARSIDIQKVLQNVKKYCEINDDNSDEQIIEYITKNSPIGNQESVIYGSKQIEIEGL
jgi:hypothetical protein